MCSDQKFIGHNIDETVKWTGLPKSNQTAGQRNSTPTFISSNVQALYRTARVVRVFSYFFMFGRLLSLGSGISFHSFLNKVMLLSFSVSFSFLMQGGVRFEAR